MPRRRPRAVILSALKDYLDVVLLHKMLDDAFVSVSQCPKLSFFVL